MAYPAQYVDPAKPEVTGTNLENTVQQNHVVAEGKYLCARCGSPYVTHECRTCRRIYCTSCSDFLHAYGDYAKHKVRPFDPNYEAYKRVGKRGTKFDTNAPSPQLLAPGEKLSEMPRDSVLALVLLIIAFILCVISVATPGWTICNHVDPSMKIGQWTTVMYGKAEGTLYFPIPLPCPEKFFKIPVRVSRAFMLGALFFTFQGMVLTLLAQKACWRSLVMLKAAAVSGFVAAVCYIVGISLWIQATLHDVDCGRGTFDGINPYGARAAQNGLVIGGHCYFSYGWYLAWICLFIVLLTGFMLFDWIRGLPLLAMLSIIAIFIAQLFSVIAFIIPRWTKGSATYAGQKMDTWSGLWRECVKNPSPDTTFEKLNYFCGSLASWKSGNTPLVRSDCATKKAPYQAVRALIIIGLAFSVVAGGLIFYAHALRKPLATKISGALCGVTFITFLIAIIIYGAMQNSSHGSCPKLPICDTNSCSLGAGWILQLVATILALIATVLLCVMRVGFEREQLTTEDHTRYERPTEIKQQPDVWVEQQVVYDYNAPEYAYTENREAAYAVDENYNYYADGNFGENSAEQYYYTS